MLDVIAGETHSEGVHRTTLLAILAALHDSPDTAVEALLPLFDQQQLSDSLLRLRAYQLATLDEHGFRLTKAGEDEVAKSSSTAPLADLKVMLQKLVGPKVLEWRLQAS